MIYPAAECHKKDANGITWSQSLTVAMKNSINEKIGHWLSISPICLFAKYYFEIYFLFVNAVCVFCVPLPYIEIETQNDSS